MAASVGVDAAPEEQVSVRESRVEQPNGQTAAVVPAAVDADIVVSGSRRRRL